MLLFGGVYFHPYEILVYVPAALGGFGSVIGGVSAWATNKRWNEKKARIFLVYGLAFVPIVDLIWVFVILLVGPRLLEGLLWMSEWLSPYQMIRRFTNIVICVEDERKHNSKEG